MVKKVQLQRCDKTRPNPKASPTYMRASQEHKYFLIVHIVSPSTILMIILVDCNWGYVPIVWQKKKKTELQYICYS